MKSEAIPTRAAGKQAASPTSPAPLPTGALLTLPWRARGRLQAPLKFQLQRHILLRQLVHMMPQSVQLLGEGQGQTRLPHPGQAKVWARSLGETRSQGSQGPLENSGEPLGSPGVTDRVTGGRSGTLTAWASPRRVRSSRFSR